MRIILAIVLFSLGLTAGYLIQLKFNREQVSENNLARVTESARIENSANKTASNNSPVTQAPSPATSPDLSTSLTNHESMGLTKKSVSKYLASLDRGERFEICGGINEELFNSVQAGFTEPISLQEQKNTFAALLTNYGEKIRNSPYFYAEFTIPLANENINAAALFIQGIKPEKGDPTLLLPASMNISSENIFYHFYLWRNDSGSMDIGQTFGGISTLHRLNNKYFIGVQNGFGRNDFSSYFYAFENPATASSQGEFMLFNRKGDWKWKKVAEIPWQPISRSRYIELKKKHVME